MHERERVASGRLEDKCVHKRRETGVVAQRAPCRPSGENSDHETVRAPTTSQRSTNVTTSIRTGRGVTHRAHPRRVLRHHGTDRAQCRPEATGATGTGFERHGRRLSRQHRQALTISGRGRRGLRPRDQSPAWARMRDSDCVTMAMSEARWPTTSSRAAAASGGATCSTSSSARSALTTNSFSPWRSATSSI